MDDRGIEGFAEPLQAGVLEQMTRRNLQPKVIEAQTLADPFAQRQTAAHRLEYLTDQGSVLLIAAEAEYYAPINGRFRWTVSVQINLSSSGDTPTESVFSVPVFLEHQHQGESDALAAAGPVIERHVGYLLDTWLGGL